MPVVNIPDFENLSIKREQLDVGTYVVQIQDPYTDKDGVAGQTSFDDKDREFIQIEYTVKQGPQQKEPDEHGSKDPTGKKIRDRVYLTGKAAFRLKQILIASGILSRSDKDSPTAKGNINLDMLMGSGTFQVKLVPNLYKDQNGNQREGRGVEIIV